MSYLVIPGKFWITGKQPDGDTVAFEPHDTMIWTQDPWLVQNGRRLPRINNENQVDIRFDAIDALEIHYKGQNWLLEYAQPSTYAFAARDFMLTQLGFNSIEWNGLTVKKANDGQLGYIITKSADIYGRVVGFVYAGEPSSGLLADNGISMTGALLHDSVNYKLLSSALVYPTFYTSLEVATRNEMNAAAISARSAGNLWSVDCTNTPMTVATIGDLTGKYAMMPKLFRRLVTHFSQNGNLSSFHEFLSANPDPVVDITNADYETLAKIVFYDKTKKTVQLQQKPENLSFVEK